MAQQRRGGFKRRKKVDYIAANKIEYVDYKDTELLSRFVSERGKILPRRVTGTSAKNQRKVTTAMTKNNTLDRGCFFLPRFCRLLLFLGLCADFHFIL